MNDLDWETFKDLLLRNVQFAVYVQRGGPRDYLVIRAVWVDKENEEKCWCATSILPLELLSLEELAAHLKGALFNIVEGERREGKHEYRAAQHGAINHLPIH